MEDVAYSVEGRTLPELWQEKYSTAFNSIREIGRIAQEEFIKQFNQDDPYVVAKRIQANRLVKEAWNCIKTLDSEYGWRKEVEFRAFETFDLEAVCQRCLKRRLKAKFEASPIDPAAAEKLQRRRDRRQLCVCTPLQQASINVDDQSSRTFARELDKHVVHEDVTPQMKKRLKRQRPDRVIGLAPTRTFKRLLPSLRSRCSPFKKKNVLYPFIVIEAKSAENNSSASFGSMLRQTAFVVRTCLRLQQNLRKESGVEHQCLVWNFLIMGEEWRLYAGVPKGEGVQLFDLWHGSMVFEDGAFQLLLIMDYLCDWACDVYRPSILACLAGGGTNLSNVRLSPSGTDASSQMSELDSSHLREKSLPWRSSAAPEHSHSGIVERSQSRPVAFESGTLPAHTALEMATSSQDSCKWQIWTEADVQNHSWAAKATIRHSNVVEFSRVQLNLPEDRKLLEVWLNSFFPGISVADAARKLVRTMCDDDATVKIRLDIDTGQMNRLSEAGIMVRTLVYCQSALKPENWQISRRLLCIICSEKALNQLTQVAEVMFPVGIVFDHHEGVSYHQLSQAMEKLKSLGGKQSAALAIFRRQLCLRIAPSRSDNNKLQWRQFSAQHPDELTTRDLAIIMSRLVKTRNVPMPELLTPYSQEEWTLLIAPANQKVEILGDENHDVPIFKSLGVLIKKPISWPKGTQDFCFFVMDESIHFDDAFKLGKMIEEANAMEEFFGVVKSHAKCHSADIAFFDQWAKDLKDEFQ